MALIVEYEVGVEVAWSDQGAPVPRVAAVGVLHVLLGLANHCLVMPSIGADIVAA